MEVFGIGPMELILVLIIAMMVFGPDKLPEIGAKLGQSMRAMRRATREFSKEVEEARQAIEAPIQELKQPLQEVTQPFTEMQQQFAPVAKAVTNPQEALRQAVTPSIAPPRPSEGNGPDQVNGGVEQREAADTVEVEPAVMAAAADGVGVDTNHVETTESGVADAGAADAIYPEEVAPAADSEPIPAPKARSQPIIFPEE